MSKKELHGGGSKQRGGEDEGVPRGKKLSGCGIHEKWETRQGKKSLIVSPTSVSDSEGLTEA